MFVVLIVVLIGSSQSVMPFLDSISTDIQKKN